MAINVQAAANLESPLSLAEDDHIVANQIIRCYVEALLG
jgi:hypothetical protein